MMPRGFNDGTGDFCRLQDHTKDSRQRRNQKTNCRPIKGGHCHLGGSCVLPLAREHGTDYAPSESSHLPSRDLVAHSESGIVLSLVRPIKSNISVICFYALIIVPSPNPSKSPKVVFLGFIVGVKSKEREYIKAWQGQIPMNAEQVHKNIDRD